MKYIRVNSGIFEVEREERAYFEPQPKLYVCKNHSGYIVESSIIKESNILKELIDKYLVVGYWKTPEIIEDFEISEFNEQDKNPVYGCIWIQLSNGAWRLEPVAKMNKEGGFDLL